MMDCPTQFWQRYLDFPGVVGNAASPAATPPGLRHGVGNLPNRECTVKKESARWRSQYGLPETELPMQQHGSRKVPRINLLIIKV